MSRFSRAAPAARRYSHKTDAQLIAAYLSGDALAWDALIERYAALIYAVLVRTGLPQADADDLFQNVCLALLNSLENLRDVSRLSAWLTSTARREVWSLHRRRRALLISEMSAEQAWELESASPVGQDDAPAPPETIIAQEEQQLIREAMTRLADRCRELLSLLYTTDPPCSYAETAQRLGLPLGSIGPTRVRCLQQLQKILNKLGF